MGYTTVFEGHLEIDKPLDDGTYELLIGLANTRRVKRDPKILEQLDYGKVEEFGVEGEFFVERQNGERSDQCPSIIDNSSPPATQPGLWFQWVPTKDRRHIVWDRGEKFYEADKWIIYLIERILNPRGYLINGVVNCQGEDERDKWSIAVKENMCRFRKGFNPQAPKPDFDKWFEEQLERKKSVLKMVMGDQEFERIRRLIDGP